MPVGGLPVALLDNVRMTLEKRDDLLACGDLFPVDYPAPSLVHDSGQQTQRSFQFLHKNTRLDHLLGIGRFISGEDRNGTFSVAPHQFSEIEQIFVARPAYRFFPAVFDLKHSFFDHPPVIAEMVAWGREKSFALDEKTGDNTNGVLKQRGVSRIVDITLHRRGIDTNRAPVLDSSLGTLWL